MKTEEKMLSKIADARDSLYEAMPSGSIDAFTLIDIIQNHLGELDDIINEFNPLSNH